MSIWNLYNETFEELEEKHVVERPFVPDYAVHNAHMYYLKLKNLSIGYTWRPKFKGISSINIYGNATNLFTITGYSWFDPEVNAFGSDTSRRGVDIYSYPSSRTFSLGLKVDF